MAKKRKEYKENLTGSHASAQRGKVKSKVKYKSPDTTVTYLKPTTPISYLNYTMSANATSSKRPRQSNDKAFDPRDEAKKPAKKTKPGPAVAPKPKAQVQTAGPGTTTQGPNQAQPQAQPNLHPDPAPNGSSFRSEQEMNAEARQTALDLGFVLLLSEDPIKAYQEAKTDLEKEEALKAIKLKEVVRQLANNKNNHSLTSKQNFSQNDKCQGGTASSAPSDFSGNAYPNLQAHADNTPPPNPSTTRQAMEAQIERVRLQKEQAEARQKKLDELVKEKRAQRQPEAEAPILSMRSIAPGRMLSPMRSSAPNSPIRGEKEKNTQPESDEDDWAKDLEEENHPVVLANNLPALEQVAEALENHRKTHVGEGEEVELLKQKIPAELVAPKQQPAAKLTIADLMPRGQTQQTGQVNPKMIANLPHRENCAEFILMQQNLGQKGMSIPDKATFDQVAGTAAVKLLDICAEWVNIVEHAEVNRGGIGIIILNLGIRRAVDSYRDLIVKQSTDRVAYQTYPTGDLMKKYAITAFIHAGLNLLPSSKIGSTIKLCNPDIRGSFTVVDCRTPKEAGKEGCRIISIEGSPEFLAYLATVPKNHQFKIMYKKIYINGGKRLDSVSANTAPQLTHSASAQLVKGVNELIMKSAQKQYQAMRAHPVSIIPF